MKPQTAAVLRLLRQQGNLGITPAFARERVGTDRLAARIAELRADGHDIETTYVTSPSRNGPARYARYILREAAPVQLTLTGTQRVAEQSLSTSALVRLPADRQRAV